MATASNVASVETQRRTFKYRIEPNKTTVKWLEQTCETHRRLNNEMLSWRLRGASRTGGDAWSLEWEKARTKRS